jgi:hypothetical protein
LEASDERSTIQGEELSALRMLSVAHSVALFLRLSRNSLDLAAVATGEPGTTNNNIAACAFS